MIWGEKSEQKVYLPVNNEHELKAFCRIHIFTLSESKVTEIYRDTLGFNIVESLGKIGCQMSKDSDAHAG
jgi:hypothetical protein